MAGKNLKVLHTAIAADTPIVVWGYPGETKTATIEDLGKRLGMEVVTIIGAVRDRTDFEGFPVYREKDPETERPGVKLYPLPWLERLIALGRRGILFLDEINGEPHIFPVLMRVLAERHVGSFKIESRIVAAGNPAQVSVSGLSLPPVVANRLIHYQWDFDDAFERWARWMTGEPEAEDDLPPIPPEDRLELAIQEVKRLVVAYLKRNAGHRRGEPDPNGGPWPSPRSWTLAARFMGAARALGYGLDIQSLGVVGAVGEVGYAFVKWLKELDLPDPEEVLKDFSLLPKTADGIFVTMNAVARVVCERPGQEMWDRFWALADEAARFGHKDLVAEAAALVARTYKSLKEGGARLDLRFTPLAKELVHWALKAHAIASR